jgi:signal transduction histidine kinase
MDDLDITRHVISSEHIRDRISFLFPDSVIIDSQFRFISVSQNILNVLGYSQNDLYKNSLDVLSHEGDLSILIEQKLLGGYFEETRINVRTRNGRVISYGVSGFYLGLIADKNNTIILKFKNLDEINLVHKMLEAKTLELDSFVYLSSHALRGPLATIKGLVNLARISKDPTELSFLIQQIDVFSEKLDDHLHKLIFFAESDKGHEHSMEPISVHDLCQKLTSAITEGSIDHPVYFRCGIQDKSIMLENGELTLALLLNLAQFFCGQSKCRENILKFDVQKNQTTTEITFRGIGFVIPSFLPENLTTINAGYSEILSQPELINCYAAKKIVLKLQGDIQFMLDTMNEFVIWITIPN